MISSDVKTLESLVQSIRCCVSWHDIHTKWQNLSEKRKGDLFEELVKAYLQLDPEYASKLKHVWLGSEVPQATARKLKLPSTDQGIDIVAETHDGEFWAVQCKYRQDTDHSKSGCALRPAPNKQFGYVIVPILHDADATADDIFKSPAFKEILTTLRALAANDDRIIEYFRSVSQGRQRKGGGSVQFDIDERLAKRINLADFAREIELRCWDRSRNSHGDRLRKRGILSEHWGLRVAANGRSSVKATC